MKIHTKLQTFTAVSLFAFTTLHAETELSPLLVQDSPLASSQITGLDTSVAAYLANTPGVRVIPQGIPGGSADLSIRGSSFSGAGLSLGGLALRNPQTEHFHADLSFPAWWLSAPVVRTGVGQMAYGEGHLAGTVALYPLPIKAPRRVTSAGVDQEGGFQVQGGFQHTEETLHQGTFGMGVFGGFSDLPNVDNLGNDVESIRAGGQLQYHSPLGQADVWFGFQEKTFGTTGYYGVNPDFRSEEKTEDMHAIALWRTFDPERPFDIGLSVREFKDDYRLDLPTGEFRNQHKSDIRMIQSGYRHPFAQDFGVTIRGAVEQEEISSSNLGNFDRYRISGTLLPDALLTDGVRVYAGIRAEIFEDFDDEILPLARIEFTVNPTLFVYAEYNESVRQPSYTELNYESPGSLGNSGLETETRENFEIGVNWQPNQDTFASAALFHNTSKNTVDWIRASPQSTRFEAENIGKVETMGVELLVRQTVLPNLDVTGNLVLQDKEGDNEPYASRYALDYAEQILTVQLDWRASDLLRVEAAQSWLNQSKNELREGSDSQWLTALAVHYRPENMENVQFSLTGSNLFDDDFQVFAGQNTYAERRFSASVSVDW
ncbi:MAG: TonB-dependent receptor [Verrucomicrobia bacterium]|nr:TonB-dependent receptor [Verrucomicrobiota bacterium]MCH8510390.1 TonB-dependent receptor [Kiritimatiellia bacterium]